MKEQALDLSAYQTFVFDCDGVVLNSNKIKTQAFYDVASIYGTEAAQTLKDYHIQNGGISRYAKFEYLITDILKKPLEKNELQQLLGSFAYKVKQALMTCEVATGLEELRQKTKQANWLIVSGGDQAELREVFAERGLDHYFDCGIFGSPATKDTILKRELNNGNITKSALFIGDSKYDYQAANQAGLDFVFISQWTEVMNWQLFCQKNKLTCKNLINELGNE
jgi:HAD superfamily hydrolase (TIGR01549 family)